MNPVEKNMLIGAFATVATDIGLEGWYMYNLGKGTPLSEQIPYITVGTPYLPPLDDWIANAGVPILLYALGKAMKKPALVQMSKGGAIYGVSQLAGHTLYRTAAQVAPASARYVLANRRL